MIVVSNQTYYHFGLFIYSNVVIVLQYILLFLYFINIKYSNGFQFRLPPSGADFFTLVPQQKNNKAPSTLLRREEIEK